MQNQKVFTSFSDLKAGIQNSDIRFETSPKNKQKEVIAKQTKSSSLELGNKATTFNVGIEKRRKGQVRQFIGELKKLWLDNIDMRFGQLLFNYCGFDSGHNPDKLTVCDPFLYEDRDILHKIKLNQK